MSAAADNANRAIVGGEAVANSSDAANDMRSRIVDTLANVGHFAASRGVDVAGVFRMAQDHVGNELGEAIGRCQHGALIGFCTISDCDAEREASRRNVSTQGRTVTVSRDLMAEIRDALDGESNDDEHDALVSVAEALGLVQRDSGFWELLDAD